MARAVVFQLNTYKRVFILKQNIKEGLYYDVIDGEMYPTSTIKDCENAFYLPGTGQGSAAM